MKYKVNVVKQITFLLMTMALAVAMVACQGAVGKTGEPGPKGDPGDPSPPAPAANLAPQARSLTFDAVQLREGGDATTVDVASNFYDPDGDDAALVLSFSVAQTAMFVDVVLDAGAGVLTITPVDAGDAVITVTASDGALTASAKLTVKVVDAGDPMYIEGSLSGDTLTFGGRQTIAGSVIESAFDGESLTFSAMTEDTTIVDVDMDNPDDPNEVTITALQVEGTATVTITATDEDGDTASHSIQVQVRASLAPVLSDMMPDAVTLDVGGNSTKVDVASYFDNHGLEALTYEASADSEAVSLSDVVDGMLTITPESADVVVVTITATNTHGSVMQTISVTVNATPPTARGTIPAQTIAAGGSRSIALDQYFTPGKGSTHDDLDYTVSVEGTAATALISGGDTLVITAGSTAGPATITVKAMDGDGEYDMQTVMVTVTEEAVVDPPTPNMAPQVKKALPNLRIQRDPGTVSAGDFTDDTNASGGGAGDNEDIDLSEHFEDQDGVLLFYKVEKKPGTETLDDTTLKVADNPVIDLHLTAATDTDAAVGKPPNFELGANTVTVEPLRPGSVTVLVTVKDVDDATNTVEFTVTVVAEDTNVTPTPTDADGNAVAATVVPDLTGDSTIEKVQPDTAIAALRRLTIGETRKVLDGTLISALFNDADFAKPDRPNEMLTLSVKYFATDSTITDETTARTAALDPDTKDLAADKVRVSHTLSTTTWNGSSTTKLTFSLTAGPEGTENNDDATATNRGHWVALIATDEYGESTAHPLQVIVNHAPKAIGPQAKDAKTLGSENIMCGSEDCMALGFDSRIGTDGDPLAAAVTANQRHLGLVGTTADPPVGGYFHDPDGDDSALVCQINGSTGETGNDPAFKFTLQAAGADAVDDTSLRIAILKDSGMGSVTIACKDAYDTHSENATLRVRVNHRNASLQ